MKRIHYLLLGLLVSLTIAAVSPGLPPTRIAPGSGITVVTNGVNNFTLTASGGGGILTSNGLATNLTVYSSGTTNRPFQARGTNGTVGTYVDKDGNLFVTSVLAVGSEIQYSTTPAQSIFLTDTANAFTFAGTGGRSTCIGMGSTGVRVINTHGFYWASSSDTRSAADTGLMRNAAGVVEVNSGTANTYRDLITRTINTTNIVATNITANTFALDKTITAPATTGNQTINKAAGRVNIAAAGTTVVVTCSLATANSIIIAVAATDDATAMVTSVVPAAGSFTINTVATTAETAFNFLIVN